MTHAPERGSALLLVLLAVVLVTAAGATSFASERDAHASTQLFHDGKAALAAAESGVATARNRLRLQPDYSGHVERIGDHRVTMQVEDLAPGVWRLIVDARPVAGRSLGARQVLTVDLETAPTDLARSGQNRSIPLPRIKRWIDGSSR